MSESDVSRRALISRSLGAGWIAANWPEIVAAQQHAHIAAASKTPTRLESFTTEQAADIEAIAAQIIPTDETPGAREAGVIYFIDRALSTFDRDKKPRYIEGLKETQAKVKELFPHAGRVTELTRDQQIELLKSIEKSAFFELVRTHTIMGFFANPEYGGNKDKIGWKLIGFEDAFAFQPPFGYYDKDYRP
jgi:gluconate 2-dehydrogenase gamma chain